MTANDPQVLGEADFEAPRSDRGLGIFLAVAGGVGTWASAVLTLDKIAILEAEIAGDEKTLLCDVNAFVSCSSVIQSEQAHAFGFPNPFIGIIAFSILTSLGVVLASGATLPRWIWAGLQAGAVFGGLFITWLQYESMFQIGNLCPWCMVVWTVTIPTVVLITRRFTGWAFLRNWTGLIIALWYIAVMAFIWFEFGSNLWA